eukprot:2977574-Pleurochrysis_carterae.AAC.3
MCEARACMYARRMRVRMKGTSRACARRNACGCGAQYADTARMRMRRACISVRVRRARAYKCDAHDAWRMGSLAHTFASASA